MNIMDNETKIPFSSIVRRICIQNQRLDLYYDETVRQVVKAVVMAAVENCKREGR